MKLKEITNTDGPDHWRTGECAICEAKNVKIARFTWLTGLDADACYPCLCEWYDGCNDTKEIRRRSLKAQGRVLEVSIEQLEEICFAGWQGYKEGLTFAEVWDRLKLKEQP